MLADVVQLAVESQVAFDALAISADVSKAPKCLPPTPYHLPPTPYPLPSTLYPLPSTLYPLPSTLYFLLSTPDPLLLTLDPRLSTAHISKAISWVHISGTMHDLVAAQPERYLQPSPALGSLLAETRAAGKQLFLLTNSSFGFVNAGMRLARATGLGPKGLRFGWPHP